MSNFTIGQRWISESEPDLGIGIINKINDNKVTILFETSNVTRQYYMVSAPLQRVKYNIGDVIRLKNNSELRIDHVEEISDLFFYSNSNNRVCETQISDAISFNTAEIRLFNLKFNKNEEYILRNQTLMMKNKKLKNPYRGLFGSRINLLPHQLYISNEISNRLNPRVMLSDEIGLGKTIEASLILKKLINTRRVNSALVIVPEHLVFQWFFELFHRFNLTFSIVDEKHYYKSLKLNINPFEERQLIICSFNVLRHKKFHNLVDKNEWDMLILDEAHYLLDNTPEYETVKKISKQSKGLMLLSAVPENPGFEHYFARLHLIDPDRYYRFDKFFWEINQYSFIAEIANKISSKSKLNTKEQRLILELTASTDLEKNIIVDNKVVLNEDSRKKLLSFLVDQHGLGRIFFRNTRKNINYFPERIVKLIELQDNDLTNDELIEEFKFDINDVSTEPEYNYVNDSRIKWLIGFLGEKKNSKVLLICRSQKKVLAIIDAFKNNRYHSYTFFHEELPIVERDKNAAKFMNYKDIQILVSSEIGSEGRNFQFADHLILFDIPFNPDLIEQRIGRLDRIGQINKINIYIPFVKNSPQHFFARWLHEGLNAFEKSMHGFSQLFNTYSNLIKNIAFGRDKKHFEELVKNTRTEYEKLSISFEKGRDRLLEMNSFNSQIADSIKSEIEKQDSDPELEYYLNDFFDFYGFKQKLIDDRTYHITPHNIKTDAFPGIDADGLTITYNREKAVSKEDIAFVTLDSELVDRAFDLILGSQFGNCTFTVLTGNDKEEVLFEIVYIAESIAPEYLSIERFFPPAPLRVIINNEGLDCTDRYDIDSLNDELLDVDNEDILGMKNFIEKKGKSLLEESERAAGGKLTELISKSTSEMKDKCNRELERIEYLKKINSSIREEEFTTKREEIKLLENYINNARLRMDSVRIIYKTL